MANTLLLLANPEKFRVVAKRPDPRCAKVRRMTELELTCLDLRYEKLRRRNERKERHLVSSLADDGQHEPMVVVRGEGAHRFVLIDGYKRQRALRKLKQDIAYVTVWDLEEVNALLLDRLMRSNEANSALEQGWLLVELNERFRLSHEELARRFDKSQSWVSRRLALVRALPREVQEKVQSGVLPAHAAMKYLVPMARANPDDCMRLVESVAKLRPSTRQIDALYTTWVTGNAQTRELVVTNPDIVLRAREEAKGSPATKSPTHRFIDDFSILIGTSRRARAQIARGILADILETEAQAARNMVQQARFECEALFRATAPWLDCACAVAAVAGHCASDDDDDAARRTSSPSPQAPKHQERADA